MNQSSPYIAYLWFFNDTDALLAERERVCVSMGCRDLRPSSRGGWQSAERANGWGCVAKCLISILLMFQAHALTAPWLDCNCLNSAPAAPSWQYNCHILTPASLDTATQPFGCLEGCYIWLHLGNICAYMVKGFQIYCLSFQFKLQSRKGTNELLYLPLLFWFKYLFFILFQ